MKYLGIDFGIRRIGLSISEGTLASPWKVLEVQGLKDSVEKVLKIIKEEGFQKIIVGLPEGKMARTVLGFVNGLEKTGLDVEASDETLSSQRALQQMISENVPLKKRRSNDAAAAAIILQNYLDSQ